MQYDEFTVFRRKSQKLIDIYNFKPILQYGFYRYFWQYIISDPQK